MVVLAAATAVFLGSLSLTVEGQSATEAPAAFDNHTNGFITQAEFDANLATFVEQEGIADGLGPVYNAQSCGECHQNPVTGGPTQISELRAGHLSGSTFVDPPGGSLINDRAIECQVPGICGNSTSIQERVPGTETVRTFRITLNTLGDGFVEAINSNTLVAIANAQPGQSGGQIAGQFIQVPVLEANGAVRGGRFGWKNQHASLLSFSSDAYLNEMGITNRFNLTENTSLGRFVGFGSGYDTVADNQPCASAPGVNCGEDGTEDINQFAAFMRATKAPPRDPGLKNTADAIAGSNLFDQIGCNICHTRSITTAAVGTIINGGALTVPAALGNKIIHPFSDFLLHDIGTGDGIVQNGGQSTRNKLRTIPLWGVRTHSRHMHDQETLTFNESILRHAGEATFVINNYRGLNSTQQNQLITFLKSL
jgi:CxxC motif-containing protein (DUF1111 family)